MDFLKAWIFLAFTLILTQAQHSQFDSDYPLPKTWWAKKIANDFYTAGRLSARQVKYAIEDGFKTIVGNFNYTEHGDYGGEVLPTTKEIERIIKLAPPTVFVGGVSGQRNGPWAKIDNIYAFSDLIKNKPKPILFYSDSAYSSTFITLCHLAVESKKNLRFNPRVNSTTFYQIAARHGFDYSSESNLRRLVSQITGEHEVSHPPVPEINPPNWRGFWLAKPVLRNFFVSGQVQSSHISTIVSAGFKTLVNIRPGSTTRRHNSDEPSQGEVNLLNIRSNTGTYSREGHRQSRARLEDTRISPYIEARWINATSRANYESSNPLEFGDHVGYNEQVQQNFHERIARTSHLEYEHMPINGDFDEFSERDFEKYKDRLMAASMRGGVLIQGYDSKQAVLLALLAAGWEYDKDSNWAVQQANAMGYDIDERGDYGLIDIFRDVLNQARPFTPPPFVKYTTRSPNNSTGNDASSLCASISLVLVTLVMSLR